MNKANEQSKILLKQYLNQTINNGDKINFFILSGVKNIGKSEIAQELSKEILGEFFYNDFLHIKDFSDYLGKEHELKIEYKDDNTTTKDLLKEFNYEDLGTREINKWLCTSPAGDKKIVLIENIERMNTSAMNAFLKTCEESLPNRIILATTSNRSRILDTIISRAVVIPFFEYSYDELIDYCDKKLYFQGDDELKQFICLMSLGRTGAIDLIHDKILGNDELKEQFKNAISILTSDDIGAKFKNLCAINNSGLIEPFLDGIIGYFIMNDMFDNAQNRLNIKKNINVNTKAENLLFYGLISE